jgi:hypothetical protein
MQDDALFFADEGGFGNTSRSTPENNLRGRERLVGAVSPLDGEVARFDSHSRHNEPQQKQHPPVA